MKNIACFLIILFISFSSDAQSILLINDNDNITQNTDTFLVAMDNSNYSNYTYYDVASSGQMPASSFLSNFDIIIYYASTDGAGLGIWDNGQNGNNAIKGFLTDGGRAWFIGSDILYAGAYSAPINFSQTSFAYEYLGLESYDSQSYGDDGGLGVSNVFTTATAPTSFPSTLGWTLGTLWWVDGVTPRVGTTNLYEMGPSNYPLYQAVCMTHYNDFLTNAMSTFFDPALILGTTTNRIDFINESLNYLWSFDLGVDHMEKSASLVTLYPTITSTQLNIESLFTNNESFEIYNSAGQQLQKGRLYPSINSISVAALNKGIYFIRVQNVVEKFIIQ